MRLAPLVRLEQAMAGGLSGPARGLVYQLHETYGVLGRREALEQIYALDREDRAELRDLGIHFGAFTLYLPGMWRAETRAFGEIFARLAAPRWQPSPEDPTALPHPSPPLEALSLRGLRAVGNLAVPVLTLERLGSVARDAEVAGQPFEVGPALAQTFAWSTRQLEAILKDLGFRRIGKGADGEAGVWRRSYVPGESPPKPNRRGQPRRRPPERPETLAKDEPAPA